MTTRTCSPKWHIYEGAPTLGQRCRCEAVTFAGWGEPPEPVNVHWHCQGCGIEVTDYPPHAFDPDERPFCTDCNDD